ncbi:diacylglycerol kinase family protein [Actinacidiphila glaucinigra]|uniref:diacylglycerol kinase family protein n=1 Tax=Actinacidiphila glaucinigra TaxID=235986 RepID=UPI00386660BF
MRIDGAAVPSRPRWLLTLPLLWALLVALGALVTGPWAGRWPVSAEDGLVRYLSEHRTAAGDAVSQGLSLVAGTQGVIAVTLLCVVALLVPPRGPRRAAAYFLAGAVAAQSAVFVLVTLCVERLRPDVPHLEQAPPTSSFPSGHSGAALALYGGLAVLAARGTRRPWRLPAVALLLCLPAAVAVSRLYAGMHHPSDVVGGLLNGACTLFVLARALPPQGGARGGPPGPRPRDAAGGRRVVVVRHPHACPEELAEAVRAVLDRHGYTDQRWTLTTAERPNGELGALAARHCAPLVVACGGDGTVRACAEPLLGTDTALAIVPCGTGNLLARNLRLPLDPAAALERALAGRTTRIDAGRVHGDGLPATCFTVMAGAGFDAAMVRDASDRLKARLGWSAYVVSGAGHLTDPRMHLAMRLDGGPELHRRARMVLVGNVGVLQGGLPLLPAARPDSGRLDLVLLNPRGLTGWAAAAGHLAVRMLPGRRVRHGGVTAAGSPVARGALEYFQARRIDIGFATPQARELDGDVVADGTRLTIEVQPGALRVHLPAPTPVPTTAAVRAPEHADRAVTSGG